MMTACIEYANSILSFTALEYATASYHELENDTTLEYATNFHPIARDFDMRLIHPPIMTI